MFESFRQIAVLVCEIFSLIEELGKNVFLRILQCSESFWLDCNTHEALFVDFDQPKRKILFNLLGGFSWHIDYEHKKQRFSVQLLRRLTSYVVTGQSELVALIEAENLGEDN